MSWKKFLIHAFIFLIPVVIGYAIVENYTRNLPLTPKIKSDFYKKYQNDIEVLVLGASQNRDAINPAFLSQKTLNLSFPDQDYYVSLKLLEHLAPTLPSFKTVIIPISYGHFETAPNQKETWKNSMYRYYFGTTLSEKFTYFKDNFLYLSYPNYYTGKINENRNGINHLDCNGYGYNRNLSNALFYKANYDPLAIAKLPVHITPMTPHPEFLPENVDKLEAMLSLCAQYNYNVILTETPTSKRFEEQKIPEVLRRKDSITSLITSKYDVYYLNANLKNDYTLKEYRDNNHLSPLGAKKFTKRLDLILKDLN